MQLNGFLLVITAVVFLALALQQNWIRSGFLSRHHRDSIESFLVTMQEYVLPEQCPDYAVYDGHNYYLIYNNRPFDGQQNPLIFPTETEMRRALQEMKCPFADRMPVEFLRRSRNHRDPQESYDRLCNKRIAQPNYQLDKCASTFGLGGDAGDLNTDARGQRDSIAPAHTDDIAGKDGQMTDRMQTRIKTDGVPFKGDKLAMLQHLSQFLDQASSDVMADYDQETCMIHEIAKDQPHLGSPDHLLKYAQAFQTGHVDAVRSASGNGGTGAPPPMLGRHLLEATDGAFPGAFIPSDYV